MEILTHLYPVRPKPSLTKEGAFQMLPLLHKYDVKVLFDDCLKYLDTVFPLGLSPDPGSDCYIIRQVTTQKSFSRDVKFI